MLLMASAVPACGLGIAGTLTDGAGAPSVDAGADALVGPGDAGQGGSDGGLVAPDASDASDASDAVDADDGGTTTAVGASAVSSVSLTVDLAKPADGPIATDGQKDGVFDVTMTGPAVALTVIRTDAAGAPTAKQEWDTWVGTDVIPAALAASFTVGATTYQLAVYESGVLVNDATGRVTLSAGPHTLRVAGANVGSFVAGNHFRVVAEAPDGGLVRGPVVAY
jgi:hypothetical protein